MAVGQRTVSVRRGSNAHTTPPRSRNERNRATGSGMAFECPCDTIGLQPNSTSSDGPLLVPHRRQTRPPADELGHQRLARRVDGGGRVALSGAEHGEEALGGPPARGVESRPAGQVHGDRIGAAGVERVAQSGLEVIEHLVPPRGPALPTPTHQRPIEAAGIVVQGRDGPTLRTRVAPRQAVFGIAPHLLDAPVGPDGDDDAAHGVADSAERPVLHPLGHAEVSHGAGRRLHARRRRLPAVGRTDQSSSKPQDRPTGYRRWGRVRTASETSLQDDVLDVRDAGPGRHHHLVGRRPQPRDVHGVLLRRRTGR